MITPITASVAEVKWLIPPAGITPRSTASSPESRRPACNAADNRGPDGRVSIPTMTVPAPATAPAALPTR